MVDMSYLIYLFFSFWFSSSLPNLTRVVESRCVFFFFGPCSPLGTLDTLDKHGVALS